MALSILYGLFALVSILNLALMRRPKTGSGGELRAAVLIPARNEERNLEELLPLIVPQGSPVYVFDDESNDLTSEVANRLGARVVRPREPLPSGWTGKNRACHQLAQYAVEETDAEWLIFLDADVRPHPEFLKGMSDLVSQRPGVSVVTGFPTMRPGQGVEPLFLAWVGWILLSTNPYGLVSRSRMGHNRFLNGQIQMWRTSRYVELWPNELVKDKIMEDVQMGRVLAQRGIPVEVANLNRILTVKMYDTWRETLDGMSKNSFEITGSYAGTIAVALFLLFVSWGWTLGGGLSLAFWATFTLSGFVVARTVRAPWWPALLLPIAITIGAYTVLRSAWWRHSGKVSWKGRVYPSG